MTFLSDGTDWLSGQLRDAAGQTVSLRRGSTTTTDIIAVGDSVDYEVTDDEGMVNRVRYRDWWIAQSDYAIGGVAVTPVQGDVVIDDEGRRWQLSPIGKTDSFGEWDGGQWILHTKRMGA